MSSSDWYPLADRWVGSRSHRGLGVRWRPSLRQTEVYVMNPWPHKLTLGTYDDFFDALAAAPVLFIMWRAANVKT